MWQCCFFVVDKIGISFVNSVEAFAHFFVISPTVFLPQLQVVYWTLQAGDKCLTWCRERLLFCPGYPQYPWSGRFVLGPLLLGIKSSCWCVTSKVVERGTGWCFWEVDQGVIVALGGWLKDCWVGSPKCGVGRRGGTACGGCGSNYLSKQDTLFSWHQFRKALEYNWTIFWHLATLLFKWTIDGGFSCPRVNSSIHGPVSLSVSLIVKKS